MVTLTDKATTKVKELMNGQANGQAEADSGLRVAVRGGGCSGFQYALAFDQQREGDQVYEYSDIRLLIDSESLPFVELLRHARERRRQIRTLLQLEVASAAFGGDLLQTAVGIRLDHLAFRAATALAV